MSDTKQPKVSTGNVFSFSNGGCQCKQLLSLRMNTPLFLFRQLHRSFVMAVYLRISEKLKTHLILSLLALPVVLGMDTGLAWGKGPVLNPAQIGTFCPPGSELADAKHTQILSIKEQTQIRKTVQGFMDLDADARRGGNPLGTAEYWDKGYTLRFEDKAAPVDWLQYVAFSRLLKYLPPCTRRQPLKRSS